VKTALFLPLLFLLATAVVAFALLAVLLAMGWTVPSLDAVISPVVLVAAIIATILVLLSRLRSVTAPLVTFAAMVFVVAAVVAGVVLLAPAPVETVNGPPWSVRRGIDPNTIYQGPRFSVVVERSIGSDLGEVIFVDHRMAAEIPRIQRDQEAYLDTRGGVVIRPGRPDIPVTELEGFGPPSLPGMVLRAAEDAVSAVGELRRSSLRELPLPLPAGISRAVAATLSVLIMALAITAIWTAMRLTRWPLLNLVASVAYGRLLVAIPRLARDLVEREPVSGWLPPLLVEEAPVVLWLALLVLMLLVSVFLPSLSDWRHHMHYGESTR
jgi:hypothetical protein